jgi:hypothetical protein
VSSEHQAVGDGSAHPPSKEDVEQVLAAQKRGEEMEESESDEPTGYKSSDVPEVPGLKVLTSLMKASFFTDFFVYHARIQYLHPSLQERVRAHIEMRPRFYRWCRNADYIARAVLMIVVIGTLTAVAWGFVYRTFFLGIQG